MKQETPLSDQKNPRPLGRGEVKARIPGLPQDACDQLLQEICRQPQVKRVVLYGSRALDRHRAGSDVDLCLEAPTLNLGELMELGAKIDDLLLPWRIDLQLNHMIQHEGLRDHIERAGRVLWER